jgi:V/A-type H+-transporting ATPase subunit I
MIVPMKKYSFIVYHDDYNSFLEKLGRLGVLHVVQREDIDKEEPLKNDRNYLKRIEKALKLINAHEASNEERFASNKQFQRESIEAYLQEIELLNSEMKSLKAQMEESLKEKERLQPWGNYDGNDLEKLKEAGYIGKLYQCPASQYKSEWEEKYQIFPINQQDGKYYFMILAGEKEEIVIQAEYVKPSGRSLYEVTKSIEQLKIEIERKEEKLSEFRITAQDELFNFRQYIVNKIKFKEVFLDTNKASDDQLMVLQGWVPEESEYKVQSFLKNENVVSIVHLPDEDDRPPVKLKNSRFSRLFEPISKLFDLPAYNELDLTPYFAPFFMLFFGFCLGDAGYGVFFILFAGILKLRAKKEIKPLLSLAQVFGIATIIFGLLSGTFFGINLIDSGYTITDKSIKNYTTTNIPPVIIENIEGLEGTYFKSRDEFLSAIVQASGVESVEPYQSELIKYAEAGIPFINSFRHLMLEPLQMFYLSILIGGIQILFGIFVRIMNITRRRGFKYALSSVGWLILIISIILKSIGLFDGKNLIYIYYSLLAISGVFILLLNNPGVNVFSRIGSGIWDSYGMVTGLFGDLLSYIRLFALGISSAILGFVFNDISLQFLDIPYVGWLFFLLLLIVGHTINIFMATLGGFIHPMRLTFVEFYKNAGFEGGGKKYNPFNINH